MSIQSSNLNYKTPDYPETVEVLILDDSQFDRKRLQRSLRKLDQGIRVTEIANLDELDSVILSKRFDMILVDFALSYGDGLQALQKIKSSALNRNSNAIMVTGNDSSSLAANAIKYGFDDYVTKNDFDTSFFSKFIEKKSDVKPINVVSFPDQSERGRPSNPVITSTEISQELLEKSLEPILNRAVNRVLDNIKKEQFESNVISLVASFHEDDEFIFKDFRD